MSNFPNLAFLKWAGTVQLSKGPQVGFSDMTDATLNWARRVAVSVPTAEEMRLQKRAENFSAISRLEREIRRAEQVVRFESGVQKWNEAKRFIDEATRHIRELKRRLS